MATMITDDCIVCGACEDECPTSAISLGEPVFIIDPERCTECVGYNETQKCADVCPVDCCVQDPEHVEMEEQLIVRALGLQGVDPPGAELDTSNSHFRTA